MFIPTGHTCPLVTPLIIGQLRKFLAYRWAGVLYDGNLVWVVIRLAVWTADSICGRKLGWMELSSGTEVEGGGVGIVEHRRCGWVGAVD